MTKNETRRKHRARRISRAMDCKPGERGDLTAAMATRAADAADLMASRGLPVSEAYRIATRTAAAKHGLSTQDLLTRAIKVQKAKRNAYDWPGIARPETPTPPIHTPGWSPNVIPDDVRDPRFIRRKAG